MRRATFDKKSIRGSTLVWCLIYIFFLLPGVSWMVAMSLQGCKSTSDDGDAADGSSLSASESASELTVSAVSGIMAQFNSSSSGWSWEGGGSGKGQQIWAQGLLEPRAYAATACPSLVTDGSGTLSSCSGGVINLNYSSCNQKKRDGSYAGAVWEGSEIITFGGGSCPSPATWSGVRSNSMTLVRTFGAGTTRTNAAGDVVVTLDTTNSSGYESSVSGGSTIAFNSGAGVKTVTINGVHYTAVKSATTKRGVRISATVWDHSLSTEANAPLVHSFGSDTITSGTVKIQHNLLKYTASSVFSNVAYDHVNCGCLPKSGSITTTFTGSKTGSETLTFSGCDGDGATATLITGGGAQATVTLATCI